MDKYEVLKYCNSYQFKLKDYGKTKMKYNDYKNDKYYELHLDGLLRHIQAVDIVKKIVEDGAFYFNEDLSKKSAIRMLATFINYKTFEYNQNLILDYAIKKGYNLNNNETRIFTIKFYLNNYSEINDIMNRILTNLVMTNISYRGDK